jgi:DNA primase
MVDIDDVLSRVSCLELAEELGLGVDSRGRCPCFHDGLDAHTNRSVDIDERVWYCHRCGRGGGAPDLLMQAKGFSFRKALLVLEDFTENKPARVEKAAPKEQKLFHVCDLGTARGHTIEHQRFRDKRYGGLRWAAPLVWPIDGGFAFCYLSSESSEFDYEWEGVKIRRFDGSKSALPGSTFTRLWQTRRGSHSAVICEGETDALAMAHYVNNPPLADIAVYSLPAGAGKWDPKWAEELQKYSQVWVCMDNDTAGQQATDKILRSMSWRWDRLVVPGLYNDCEEALRNGWQPKL